MIRSWNRPFVRPYKYYETLGVARNATPIEIMGAYLKLAKRYHPEVNPDPEAHEKFKKISEAYKVLSDPISRADYDKSPAECPLCCTHKVIQTAGSQWRCRHCGCAFNPSIPSKIIETAEQAAVSQRPGKTVSQTHGRKPRKVITRLGKYWGLVLSSLKELRDSFVEAWEILIGKRQL